MTPDMLLVFSILAVTILLFVSDRLRLDLIAIMALLTLLLTGILTLDEALAGFSNPIVLIIAGLFVVGGGLFQTGVANKLGGWLARVAGKNEITMIVLIMVVVSILSAFISSTGTVAVFLPVVVSLALSAKISPSRLLIPLSFASLLGGMLTLIGTPPNIVVSDQLRDQGLEPFSFFAFTPIGLVMLTIGIVFMVFVGRHLMPDRSSTQTIGAEEERTAQTPLADIATTYELPGNMFRLRLRRSSPLTGLTLAQADLRNRYYVNVLEKQAWPDRYADPSPANPVTPETILETYDILHVQGTMEQITRLAREQGLGVLPTDGDEDRLMSKELGLVEVLLTPNSRLIGQTLKDVHFRRTYGATVLSVLRMGKPLETDLAETPFQFGDTLLVEGTWVSIDRLLRRRQDFVVVGQPREMTEAPQRTERATIAIVIMLGMLLLLTFQVLPTATAILLAATAMVLFRCLTMEEAYQSMNWESIVLIAGMLPMATALQKTGGIDFIANGLTGSFGAFGPLALMLGLFLLTSAFSQFISNTATTVLVAPIAYQAALSLEVSPYPLLMTVAIAASTAFATPIASPVNTLILGPGGYRFGDFAKVGIPLQLLIMLATLLVVPILFPL